MLSMAAMRVVSAMIFDATVFPQIEHLMVEA
jgi:hypothetical protein